MDQKQEVKNEQNISSTSVTHFTVEPLETIKNGIASAKLLDDKQRKDEERQFRAIRTLEKYKSIFEENPNDLIGKKIKIKTKFNKTNSWYLAKIESVEVAPDKKMSNFTLSYEGSTEEWKPKEIYKELLRKELIILD